MSIFWSRDHDEPAPAQRWFFAFVVLWSLFSTETWASTSAPPTRPPFEGRCANVFLVDATGTWTRGVHTAPENHIWNTRQQLAEIDSQGTIPMVLFPAQNPKNLCAPSGLCFAIEKFVAGRGLQDPIQLTVRTPDGRKFDFTAMFRSDYGSTVVVTASPKTRIESPPPLDPTFRQIEELHHDAALEGAEKMTSSQLADYLTKKQLKTSVNARVYSRTEEYPTAIRQANELLVEVLRSKRDLLESDLEQFNWYANQGIHPYNDALNAPMAGVIRGTADRQAIVEGELVLVDLLDFQVNQTSSGIVTNRFVPAENVRQALNSLLQRVNRIDSQTNPSQIFALYREFIEIHPFADGNGRTGRILLNFMLLKAQLPIAVKSPPSLYYTPTEILLRYMKDLGL